MHLSETMFVGLLSVGAAIIIAIVGAIIAGAKADGRRGAQLDQLIKGQADILTTTRGMQDDIEEIRALGATTTTAVAVHEARLSDHDRQLAAMQATRHHG